MALLAEPSPSHAVGLDGPAEAQERWGAGVGVGWDHVGGLGRDGYGFLELYAHGDARVWRRLVLGAAVSVRRDLFNHNYALDRLRGGASGVAAQLFVGYDGERFHLSVGPWLYGDDRDGRRFRATVVPYGALRLRIGSSDRWHVRFGLVEGRAYTAEGAGTAARLLVGAPPRGRHRVAAGLYTSIGENTAGIAIADEIAAIGREGSHVRWGALIGSDVTHLGSRPEVTAFCGLVY